MSINEEKQNKLLLLQGFKQSVSARGSNFVARLSSSSYLS